jgi:hypothetical protein
MVLSSLAEGAARLVVRHVLARPNGCLVVPLPLPKPIYMADFESDQSKHEFMLLLGQADEVVELPPAATRNEAYEAAGYYVVDRCDVLITIWDGQPAQGRGGTATVVSRARACGQAIAWVHASNRRPGRLDPTSLG